MKSQTWHWKWTNLIIFITTCNLTIIYIIKVTRSLPSFMVLLDLTCWKMFLFRNWNLSSQHWISTLFFTAKMGNLFYSMKKCTPCISYTFFGLFRQVCDWLVSCWKASDLSQDCDHCMSPEGWGGIPITRPSYSPVCEERRQSAWYHWSTGEEEWKGFISIH